MIEQPPATIRRASLDDMPFIVALAQERYPGRHIEQGIPWMEWCIGNDDRLVLVGPHSIGVAQVSDYYGYERRGRLDMLATRPGAGMEAFKIVRQMIAWAAERGARGAFRLDADTGADFAPFARRLGGRPIVATYFEIPYTGVPNG